jgi:hypothetical protein
MPFIDPRLDLLIRMKYTSIASLISSGLERTAKIRAVPVTESQTTAPSTSVHSDVQDFVDDLNQREAGPIEYWASDHYRNMISLHDELVDRLRKSRNAGAVRYLSVDLQSPLALIHRVDETQPWKWIRIGPGSAAMTSSVYRVQIEPGIYQALVIEFV